MTVKPTEEELVAAYMDDTDDYESVYRKSDDNWRHGSTITEVFKRLSDNTFWQVRFRASGDGEYNGMRDREFDFCQVEPKEVKTITYVAVKS